MGVADLLMGAGDVWVCGHDTNVGQSGATDRDAHHATNVYG